MPSRRAARRPSASLPTFSEKRHRSAPAALRPVFLVRIFRLHQAAVRTDRLHRHTSQSYFHTDDLERNLAAWAFVVLRRRVFHDGIKASFPIRHLKSPSKFQAIGANCIRMPQLTMSARAGADIDDREKLRQAGTSGDAVHSRPVPTKPRNITEIDASVLRRISPANNRCGLLGVASLHFVGFVAERLVSRRSYAARHNRPAFRVSVALRVESVSPAGGPHPKHSFSFGLCTS